MEKLWRTQERLIRQSNQAWAMVQGQNPRSREMSFYSIREKVAYSKAGYMVAKVLQSRVYKNSRIHWIQQAMADGSFSKLK